MSDTLSALAFDQAKAARNLAVANLAPGRTFPNLNIARPLERAYGRALSVREHCRFVADGRDIF